jgi:hypothetical protein
MNCKNDCARLPLFPRPIFNRPGLPRIEYRIGSYAEVRAHLLAQLDRQPVLSAWTHREVDDPGIALLESDAVVADILTFYQSLYANEVYLRTAQWHQSVSDLVRLTGYRLAPGLAGEATFALTIKGNVPVTVPKGFGLKAQLEAIEKPVEFETRAALDAHPALNAFSLYRPQVTPALGAATQVLRLASSDVALAARDRLLLGQPSPATGAPAQLIEPEIVTVAETWEAFGQRYVRLEHGLQRRSSAPGLRAYKLGETLRHFGHNAPNTINTVSSQGVPSTTATSFGRLLNAHTTANVEPDLSPQQLPLDREFAGVSPGDTVLIQGRFARSLVSGGLRFTLPRKVVEVEPGSFSWGMLTGASTLLTLDRDLAITVAGHAYPFSDVRTLTVLQVTAPPFDVCAQDINDSAVSGVSLRFFGPAVHATALTGRRLLLVHADGTVGDVTVTSVAPGAPDGDSFHTVVLNSPVNYADHEYDAPSVTVYGNVADASQGKTLAEVAIGSGDERQSFQTFRVPKTPLTYLFDATRTPVQVPELTIYVQGTEWTRVETLFAAAPTDQVYIVREDASGTSSVQFGDGKTGARLPSGRNNVVALYRIGLAAHGPQKLDTRALATGKLTQLDKVFLPRDVTTGADPEDAAKARLVAPAKLQALGRLVSIADYEAEARMLPNVLKARARWAAPDGSASLVLTVLTQSESEVDLGQIRAAFAAFSRCRGPARHPVLTVNGHRQYVFINATVAYDPAHRIDVLTCAAKQALGVLGEEGNGIDGQDGLFGVRRREFHASVHTSEIVAALQNLPGVLWVQLHAAHILAVDTPPPVDPALIPLPGTNSIPTALLACPMHALMALHTRHLLLTFVSAQLAAGCQP